MYSLRMYETFSVGIVEGAQITSLSGRSFYRCLILCRTTFAETL